jgi:hypothetical protein
LRWVGCVSKDDEGIKAKGRACRPLPLPNGGVR